jgi:hypothetical protein
MKEALEQVFKQCREDVFFDINDFAQYHAVLANPLKNKDCPRDLSFVFLRWSYRYTADKSLEEIWSEFILDFIQYRLALSGCVSLGIHNNRLCFALTAMGRYHLGYTSEFIAPKFEKPEIFVQPNFEVVFLGPSALAEAEIGQFAERKGHGVGTLFKITKASILHAAEMGLTDKKVMDILERFCTKEIAPNIFREISGWFGLCCKIRFKSAILIICPDQEIAMKVKSTGKQSVTSLAPCILEVSSSHTKKILIQKLRKQGIFVE